MAGNDDGSGNGNGNGGAATINVGVDEADEAADLEKAVSETGYGTFNALLLLAAIPIAWTGIFDTTTAAFFISSAECDFELTFFRKGVLLAFPFVAMTLTSFIWDYVTPYVGIRNLFVLGLLADTVLNVLGSAVDSYHVLLLVKFLSGILVGGPFSMVLPYLSEFHSVKYKASFARWAGLAVNAGIVIPACLAFTILPQPLLIDVFDRPYNEWRIYLLVCSMVPMIGLLAACALPQTPKYLVEIGRPEEALKLLRRMYSVNTRKPAETFPIRAFRAERKAPIPTSRRPLREAISERIRLACYNAKLLFSVPYLRAVSFLGFLQFASMLGFNTMRLWVPHMFMILSNFDAENWTIDRPPTMCEMLHRRNTVPARPYSNCPYFDDICMTWKINAPVYQKSTIIATSTVGISFLVGLVTNTELRKKLTLLGFFLITVICGFGMNWAQQPLYMLILASSIIIVSRITGNIVTSVNVDVIPAPLRSTSLSALTTFGNVGAVLGNLIFSALLDLECVAAFAGLACLFLACVCTAFLHPEPVRTSPKTLARSDG